MAIISIANASSLKIKFDKGEDLNGDRVQATKTYGSLKQKAANADIMEFARGLEALQEHTLVGVNKIDNTSLSE